jgi:hypothetical protein
MADRAGHIGIYVLVSDADWPCQYAQRILILVRGRKIDVMRPVVFGEALPAGTRLTLLSADKPDRFFTVIKFWMDATSGVALELKTGVPSYQVEDEEGRIHLLLRLPIAEEGADRWEVSISGLALLSRRPLE